MFNQTHIIYIVISAIATLAIVIPLFFIKNKTLNKVAIWFFAISTLVIHFSGLWYTYLTQGYTEANLEYIFPVFPCHICMWLLVISATVLDKDNALARILKDFTFLGGTVGGIIGIVFNFNFANNPTLTDYYVLKGLLSHSTMVAGCILLFVAGGAAIRLKRSLTAVACGFSLFIADGLLINYVFARFGFEECNAMYLLHAPFEQFPFINIYTIVISGFAVTAVIAILYELAFVPHGERWYNRRKKK